MKGFFDKEQLQAPAYKSEKGTLSCASCGLYKYVMTPKMEPYGQFEKGIMVIGEGPGCVSGETLIDTAYRNKSSHPKGIPIKDLVGKSDFYVYSYDTEAEELVLGKVKRVWRTGRKETYRVTYEWFAASREKGVRRRFVDSIIVTANHPFLLRRVIKQDPFKGLESSDRYLSLEKGLSIGHSLQPFLSTEFGGRRIIGTAGGRSVKESILLTEFKIGRKIKPGQENCHHKDRNPLNDGWDNLDCLTIPEHARHHMTVANPMSNPVIKENHARIMKSDGYRTRMSGIMKKHFENPENYDRRIRSINAQREQTSQTVKQKFVTDPIFYYHYLLGRAKMFSWEKEEIENRFHTKFPDHDFPPISDNHKIISIEYIGKQDVYDMEVEKYHNFAAQGIFVHNSDEDLKGRPWQGKMGRVLQSKYRQLGIDLFRDCVSLNSVNCRPVDNKGNNRPPTDHEVACCRQRVLAAIKKYQPKVIILQGNSALSSLLTGYRWKGNPTSISAWRGWAIPDEEFGAWICPTFHPSFIERQEEDNEADVLWGDDLRQAFLMVNEPFPIVKRPEDCVIISDDIEGTLKHFLSRKSDVMAFDIECTGIKPYNKENHRIVTISFCDEWDLAYSMSFPTEPDHLQLLKKLLEHPKIGKIAANMKHEDNWLTTLHGINVRPWNFDTMQASHVLNNQPGITGLKFQSYVKFGVVGYDQEVEPYLKSPHANDPNRIMELVREPGGLQKLLLYNGIDSLMTFRLAIKQKEELYWDVPF